MENSVAVQYCVLQKVIIIRIPTISLSGMLYRHDLSVPLPARWTGIQACRSWDCEVQAVVQDLYLAPCDLFLQFWIILGWIFFSQYEYHLFMAAHSYRLRSISTKCPLFTSIMNFLSGYRFGEGGGCYKQTFSFIAFEFVRMEARLFVLVFFRLALSPPHLWRPAPKNILSWAYVLLNSISILIYMAWVEFNTYLYICVRFM